MKNQLGMLFLLLFLLAQTPAFAQSKHSIAFRYVWYNYITPQDDNFDFGQDFENIFSDAKGSGLEIAYQNRLFPNGFLVIPVKVGVTQTTAGDDAPRQFVGSLDALFQYSLFKHGSLINVPLHAGVGSTWFAEDEEFDFGIPLGLGINVRLLPNLYLNGQTQYRVSFNERHAWHYGFGLTYFFGQTITPPPADRDKDGISDTDDKCPDQPGTAALMGCPDRDGDGIADRDDICPDQAGVKEFYGCPDRDGDGVVDQADACPDVVGSKSFYGCPDTDDDGIEDRDDRCPTEAGPIGNLGCPIKDRDNDGVADADDRCPDNPGAAGNRGCPDRDNDGVVDIDDRCPDSAGPAANRGCPEIKAEDKAKLIMAVKTVEFNTGKATLLASSFPTLDEVAKLMSVYPDYSLTIAGYTDSQGDAGLNLNLSKKRAQACYDYLVKKGIPASRMTHDGFGETKPVADNMNAAGRAKNRRVEFDMKLK